MSHATEPSGPARPSIIEWRDRDHFCRSFSNVNRVIRSPKRQVSKLHVTVQMEQTLPESMGMFYSLTILKSNLKTHLFVAMLFITVTHESPSAIVKLSLLWWVLQHNVDFILYKIYYYYYYYNYYYYIVESWCCRHDVFRSGLHGSDWSVTFDQSAMCTCFETFHDI